MTHVSDSERRARLAVRHALAPNAHTTTPEAATRSVVAMHATDAPSVHLSIWARTTDVTPDDIDRSLYVDRSLIKQLAMRRTLFVFPREVLPAVLASASARVAASEGARMARELVRAGITNDGAAWLDRAGEEVMAVLAQDGALSAAQLRRAVPRLDVTVGSTGNETWSAPQILTLLGATGTIMRGPVTGRFPLNRPLWTLTGDWLGEPATPSDPASGYRELVRQWLSRFGPGTEDDIVWWLGSTKATVRTALAELGAVRVTLDGPVPGWVLPGDLETTPNPEPWTALLPPLDPTVMGWKDRRFYLGEHSDALFDTRGNAGTTAWVDGRIVGCWVQDGHGAVQLRLLEPLPRWATASLCAQAEALTDWLGSVRSPTGYRSPAMRGPA